jgi:hypothetical protein
LSLKLLLFDSMVTSYAGLMGWNGSSGYGGDETTPWLVRACAGLTGRT